MKAVAVAVSVALLSSDIYAQQGPPPDVRGGGMSMATRPVAKYTDLEQNLMESFRNRDKNAAQKLLAENFDVRFADRIDPIAGDDWLREVMAGSLTSFRVRDVSVREFSDVDVVGFLLDRQGTVGGKPFPRTEFVVDVWDRGDGRLETRYIAVPSHPLPPSNQPDRR